MMKKIHFKKAVLCSLIVLLFHPGEGRAASAFTAQSNLNLGMDIPANDASHTGNSYLLRFQLSKAASYLSPRASFTVDYGSNLFGGEFNLGLVSYPFNKLREELRAQPYIGVEGDLFLGSRDDKVAFSPGGGMIAGVDVRLTGNFGMTLESSYIVFPNQKSARLWLGFNFSSGQSGN